MNIVFDLDGTLVDSAKVTMPAFELICPKYGIAVPDEKKVISAIGYANPTFYCKIFEHIEKKILIAFGKEIEDVEKDTVKNVGKGLLFPGVLELLDAIKEKGNKMYIASTGDADHVHSCLEYGGIGEYFEKVFCGKPDKELMVAQIMKIAPKEKWIMIGDKRKDSKAAKYNGIFSIGAGYGYCLRADYDEFDCIVSQPLEILNYINSSL